MTDFRFSRINVTRLSPILGLILMLLAGLAGGLALTRTALDWLKPPGAFRYSAWVTWLPTNGNAYDPYSQAVFARRGDIPLTSVEGIAFFASVDQDGTRLNSRCTYEIAGLFPPARAWTLFAYRPSGLQLVNDTGRAGFTSSEVVLHNGLIKIILSPEPQAGNWLPSTGDTDVTVLLRLYDTPLSAAGSVLDVGRLPVVRRLGCPK
jgi:hypothetical protein